MALVESLQKEIIYMEEQLLDHIAIEDIAKQANLSPFHFQRTFMILTDPVKKLGLEKWLIEISYLIDEGDSN